MKLFLTGEPCTQQRHCYYVEGPGASFIVDCGYQRCYGSDALPHLRGEHIHAAKYLFLTHSHENQSGALPHLLAAGFSGRVVLTTETARQLPFPIDDPIVLEAHGLPYQEFELPGGLRITWGRSGHCSGSAWYRLSEGGRSVFFSGDYYLRARIHASDPIVGMRADLAVLDCDYGTGDERNERGDHIDALFDAIAQTLSEGRPVLLPVPKYGRAMGLLSYVKERLPETDIFGDTHFLTELGHLDANAVWIRPEAQELLSSVFVRSIPDGFIALGIYFVSDPQLDTADAGNLVSNILACGGRIFFTGTVEPNTHAALLMNAGVARRFRYDIHCTQADVLRIASQNDFGGIIAYHSDFAPTQPCYDV